MTKLNATHEKIIEFLLIKLLFFFFRLTKNSLCINVWSSVYCKISWLAAKKIFLRKHILKQIPQMLCKLALLNNFSAVIIPTRNSFIGGPINSGDITQS